MFIGLLTNPFIGINIRIMIPRLLERVVINKLAFEEKLILVLGARQVGKTVLIKNIKGRLEKEGRRTLYLNCDLAEDLAALDTTSGVLLGQLTKDIDYLFIDEAQRLSNAGLTLKIILDNFSCVKVLATGSSSFELKNKLSDALTGRYLDFILYPLSFAEVLADQNLSKSAPIAKNQANALLLGVLLYGLYPEIYEKNNPHNKLVLLDKIVESYLFKDILSFQKVRHSQAIKDLTAAVAYQVGSEVNEDELANRVKIDRKTVLSYLDILEKAYVIIRVYPFSKNPRREIGRKYKVYFVDLGIRNALVKDFNPLNLRADIGCLWENFLIIERLKTYANMGEPICYNFWRSYGGAEVDYLEKTMDKNLEAFEFKYGGNNLSKGAASFTKQYKIKVNLINQGNYLPFIDTTKS